MSERTRRLGPYRKVTSAREHMGRWVCEFTCGHTLVLDERVTARRCILCRREAR